MQLASGFMQLDVARRKPRKKVHFHCLFEGRHPFFVHFKYKNVDILLLTYE